MPILGADGVLLQTLRALRVLRADPEKAGDYGIITDGSGLPTAIQGPGGQSPIGGGSTTLVNDLVTGGTSAALTAQQGVVLNAALASKLTFVVGAPTGGADGDYAQRVDGVFAGLLYKKISGVWTSLGYSSAGISNPGGDITNQTFVAGTDQIATYTLNNLPWTMSYNGNGSPNTETTVINSITLTKTYNYDGSGRWTGMSGAVNAGSTPADVIANLPTAANSAPGDRFFANDVNSVFMQTAGGTQINSVLGRTMQFVGTTGTGIWRTQGNGGLTTRVGVPGTPLGSLAGAVAASALITATHNAVIPGALVKVGARFKAVVYYHRPTGSQTANINTNTKIGVNNSTADTTVRGEIFGPTQLSVKKHEIDIFIISTTQALCLSSIGNQTGETDASGCVTITIAVNSPIYVNASSNLINASDTLELLAIFVDAM